ncbi:MAG TPA: enoyl-CoA hydratase/isomerase family protein [Solirubrobacteraceae bacterium]|jgi:enoyl-CoA hydratase|nr:enoyl-CoA hydratase/isomerase family protein [Solirubrobacteraceae bacterium]
MTVLADEAVLDVVADGPVRVLTMNRPERKNAVDAVLHSELTYVWSRLLADRDVRVVVITGAGGAFSAGGDAEFLRAVNTDAEFRWRALDEARRLVGELVRFPLPVIAAVNGPAVGLGSSLASLCDLVLMSDTAYFADPHVLLGVAAADGAVATWPQQLGPQRAKYHLFTGEPISADQALEWGLANQVLPAQDVLPAAVALAHRLAGLPAAALRATKRAVNLHLEHQALAVMDYATTAEEGHFADPALATTIDGMTRRR